MLIPNRSINRPNLVQGGGTAFGAFIRGLAPSAWYRFNTGITVTGAGVSQWSDQTANARHVLQGTDAARPPLQADGSILFDGTAQFLQSAGFVVAQPWSAYFLGKQVTWTINDSLFDVGANSGVVATVWQNTATPSLALSASTALIGQGNLAVDTYGVVCAVGNGASSLTQVNQTAPVVGNAGTSAVGLVTLGARVDAAFFGNIRMKEFILFPGAHDANTRFRVVRYLSRVGQLAV